MSVVIGSGRRVRGPGIKITKRDSEGSSTRGDWGSGRDNDTKDNVYHYGGTGLEQTVRTQTRESGPGVIKRIW